jgi:hypothetical protein
MLFTWFLCRYASAKHIHKISLTVVPIKNTCVPSARLFWLVIITAMLTKKVIAEKKKNITLNLFTSTLA